MEVQRRQRIVQHPPASSGAGSTASEIASRSDDAIRADNNQQYDTVLVRGRRGRRQPQCSSMIIVLLLLLLLIVGSAALIIRFRFLAPFLQQQEDGYLFKPTTDSQSGVSNDRSGSASSIISAVAAVDEKNKTGVKSVKIGGLQPNSISPTTLMPVERILGKTNTSFILKAKKTSLLDEEDAEKSKKPIIAIMAASRSKKTWENATSTDLFRILLPSIARTVSEYDVYDVRLYVAIDSDDTFYYSNNNSDEFASSIWLDLMIPSFLTVHVYIFPKTIENRIPFNDLAQAAYADGAEYYCRTNDDSEFVSTNWITQAVHVLTNIYNPPNLGVVGPTCLTNDSRVNQRILTHDFCHQTHLQIFEGQYYPTEIRNWCLDDWITGVYGKKTLGVNRMTPLTNWTVIHHVSSPRYRPTSIPTNVLQQLYVDGLHQVRTFVNKTYPASLALFRKHL